MKKLILTMALCLIVSPAVASECWPDSSRGYGDSYFICATAEAGSARGLDCYNGKSTKYIRNESGGHTIVKDAWLCEVAAPVTFEYECQKPAFAYMVENPPEHAENILLQVHMQSHIVESIYESSADGFFEDGEIEEFRDDVKWLEDKITSIYPAISIDKSKELGAFSGQKWVTIYRSKLADNPFNPYVVRNISAKLQEVHQRRDDLCGFE